MSIPQPCLLCGQPTSRQIEAQAELARGALEILLDRIGWGEEPAFSRAIDRLVQLKEDPA
jgi:hypothetical protein